MVILKKWIINAILLIITLSINKAFAENTDSTKVRTFSGAATITTKGLSTFPNLTLGKPAAILDFSVGDENFRFDPTLRFGLDGKPWTFIFWVRYELFRYNRFQFRIGAHPAYAFKTLSVFENAKPAEIHRVHQYFAGEISPLFLLTRNISAGPYYIYAGGVSKGSVKNSNFLSARINFSNIQLSGRMFLRFMAQAYYLKMDENNGVYVNSNLSANLRDFPFSVSSTVNYKIESTIPGDNFLWNINLTYSFGGKYRKI